MNSTPQPSIQIIPPPPTQSNTNTNTPPSPIHQKTARGHSCILCQQRKVRCGRQKPRCSNCVKARAECIQSTPAVPRRRRRKLGELDVAARLRKYQHSLRVNGIQFDGDDDDEVMGGGESGSANAGAGAADGSRFNRQEKTSDPRVII